MKKYLKGESTATLTPEHFALIERVVEILKGRRYITPDVALHLDAEVAELRLDLELHEAQAEVRELRKLREEVKHWREVTLVLRVGSLSESHGGMIERFRRYMTSSVPATASPEIERLRVAIRRHEETIRLLEMELSETRRVLEQKIERLAVLVERWQKA